MGKRFFYPVDLFMTIDYKHLETLNLSQWRKANPNQEQQVVEATSFLPPTAPLRQRLWHLVNDQYESRVCANPTCGEVVGWCEARNIYKTYCCPACRSKHGVADAKKRVTMLNRYGVDNLFKDVGRMKKARKEKLGVEFALQSDQLLEKAQKTNIERYGERTILLTADHIQDRLQRVEAMGGQQEVNTRIRAARRAQIASTDGVGELANSKVFDHIVSGNSSSYVELTELIRSFLPLNVEIQTDTYAIIPPEELNIYIPSVKLAIEFDEILSHSESWGSKKPNHHLEKTQRCAQLGIRLIHVFEDEWMYKRDIVISRIRQAIGGSIRRIHARKCDIFEIDKTTSSKFFDTNHIQGAVRGGVCYGLEFEGELVSAMSFGAARYRADDGFEILRMASVLNSTVVGGASKLFKHYVAAHSPTHGISYADKRWTVLSSSTYEHLGFKRSGDTSPGYKYFNRQTYPKLYNRQQFQKHKLSSVLSHFDQSLTEWENMKANGYDRIWDCGNVKWVWTK